MPDFKEGDSASITRIISDAEVRAYAEITGDTNPVHLHDEYAQGTRFGRRIAHGMLSAGLISAVLAKELPGPGAIYLGQTLRFTAPVYLGDAVTATVSVVEYDPETHRMTLTTICTNQKGEEVIRGEARVLVSEGGSNGADTGR